MTGRTDTPRLLVQDLTRRGGDYEGRVRLAVDRVLKSGWYILGPEVERFEAAFAAYLNVGHAVGVANGTDALELALRALDCGPGDEVITVANAGCYATGAICLLGATPVFVDIDAVTLNASVEAIAAAVTPHTKAIVVTHLFGRLADIERIVEIASRAGIAVIEDCAQAHGANRGGRQAGSWGTFGCFSFYPTKNLGAAGDAGAIVTNDAQLAQCLRRLRQYGWRERYVSGNILGRNSRLDEMQAAILSETLPLLNAWNERRRVIVDAYRTLLADCSNVVLPARGQEPEQADYVAHLCVARSPRRAQAMKHLSERNIATAIHYPIPDHRQDSVVAAGFGGISLPVTERAVAEIFTLPCFPEMTDDEIRRVADSLTDVAAMEGGR